jgi:hypothetical protein
MLEFLLVYIIGLVPAFFMVGVLNVFLPKEKAPSGFYILSWVAFGIIVVVFIVNFIVSPLYKGYQKNCTDLPEKTVRFIINIFKKQK